MVDVPAWVPIQPSPVARLSRSLKVIFTGFSGFLPPQKTTRPKSNSTMLEDLQNNHLGWCAFFSQTYNYNLNVAPASIWYTFSASFKKTSWKAVSSCCHFLSVKCMLLTVLTETKNSCLFALIFAFAIKASFCRNGVYLRYFPACREARREKNCDRGLKNAHLRSTFFFRFKWRYYRSTGLKNEVYMYTLVWVSGHLATREFRHQAKSPHHQTLL